MLQNSFSAKENQLQQSNKKPTPTQQIPVIVHSLSPSLNNQHSVIYTPQPSEIDFTICKLIKTLPNLPLFIDGKNPSINQWLSKM